MSVGRSRVALSDTFSLHTTYKCRSMIYLLLSWKWINRKDVKTLRRNKVDTMELTVFLERLRLTASYTLSNILSVAGGQLSG